MRRASATDLRYPSTRMTPGIPSEKAKAEPESVAAQSTPSPHAARGGPSKAATAGTRPATTKNDAPVSFVTATHEALFQPEEPRCDVCEAIVPSGAGDADDEGDGDAIEGGHGLYLWLRSGEVTFEEPPLCAACAAAITMSALQRWDLEEEEG